MQKDERVDTKLNETFRLATKNNDFRLEPLLIFPLHLIILDYNSITSMSLVHISSLDELKKQDRFYLRYYRTVIEARKLNQ